MEELLLLEEHDLLIHLGKSFDQDRLGGKGFTPHEYVNNARSWYFKNRAELVKKICSNEDIKKLHKNSRGIHRAILAAAIADALTGYLTGVTLTTIAVLLANEGLESLCKNVPSD